MNKNEKFELNHDKALVNFLNNRENYSEYSTLYMQVCERDKFSINFELFNTYNTLLGKPCFRQTYFVSIETFRSQIKNELLNYDIIIHADLNAYEGRNSFVITIVNFNFFRNSIYNHIKDDNFVNTTYTAAKTILYDIHIGHNEIIRLNSSEWDRIIPKNDPINLYILKGLINNSYRIMNDFLERVKRAKNNIETFKESFDKIYNQLSDEEKLLLEIGEL